MTRPYRQYSSEGYLLYPLPGFCIENRYISFLLKRQGCVFNIVVSLKLTCECGPHALYKQCSLIWEECMYLQHTCLQIPSNASIVTWLIFLSFPLILCLMKMGVPIAQEALGITFIFSMSRSQCLECHEMCPQHIPFCVHSF